eukprot:801245_1
MSDLDLVGYWQGYACDSINPYPLNQIPETVKYIPIAFAKPVFKPEFNSEKNKFTKENESIGPLCNTWTFDNGKDPDPFLYSTEQIKQWVNDINNRGTDQLVLLSLMDTAKNHWYPNVDIELFAQNVAKSVNEWGLGGVDIDAESGMPTRKYVETFTKLIKCLRQEMGETKIISYTCYTQSSYDTDILSACKQDINFLNTMAYWDSTNAQISLFEHYAKCIGNPNKVAIGCKAGNYPNESATSIETVKQCAAWCQTNGYKRMMLWSLTRDVKQITHMKNGEYLDTMLQNMQTDDDWIEINNEDLDNNVSHLKSCSIL